MSIPGTFDVLNPHQFQIDAILPPSGYSDKLKAGDTRDVLFDMCGAASRDFPKALWIEPKDWADKARDNDTYHTWGMNYVTHYTAQNPTHECTAHSLVTNVMACRNRLRSIIYTDGPKAGYVYAESSQFGDVWLSPLSVYNEANPRRWGGAGVRQVLEIATRRGILPDKLQPIDYGFEHSLTGTSGEGNKSQSGGQWVSVAQMPSGWEATAMLFKPDEVIFPESYEQAVCLVLHGMLVSVGRNGHAIPWAKYMARDGSMLYPDSYNVTRVDSSRTVKYAWQGAFAVASVTIPDDWMKPAK